MEKIFVDGIIAKRHEKAPEFVLVNLAFNDKFIEFYKQNNKNGWLNTQVKKSQGGKIYIEVDTYVKNEAPAENSTVNFPSKPEEIETIEYPEQELSTQDIPF